MNPTRQHLALVKARHDGDLESACTRCGACCQAKVHVNGIAMLVKGLHCRHLITGDGGTRCAVYGRRREAAPWCLDLVRGVDRGIFPDCCPYVAGKAGYQGPVLLEGTAGHLADRAIRKALAAMPCPDWADPAGWREYVEGANR